MAEKLIKSKDPEFIRAFCGVADKNSKAIEKKFGVNIFLRGEGFLVKGEEERVARAAAFVEKARDLFGKGALEDLKAANILNFEPEELESINSSKIRVSSSKRKYVSPRTSGQRKYIEAIRNLDITFVTGPAGTGKTYLAMAMAVNYLIEGKARRIILTRPAIEAGESLGFLPGDLQEKFGPYLRPLYDALYDMMEPEVIDEYLESGIIEIAPLAYMRGRTLNSSFVILDEAQNCSTEQLKMFLTRLGFDSRMVIAGDITQSDLPGGEPLGLLESMKILKVIKGVEFVNLTKKDVVRHPLIQKIVQAYEDFYKKE